MQTAKSVIKTTRKRPSGALAQAWIALLGLSFATAVLTLLPVSPHFLAGGILVLAFVKARVILARYLDLGKSPGVMLGFTVVLGGFVALIFGLYLI